MTDDAGGDSGNAQVLPEWYSQVEQTHKNTYSRLDELWTQVGDAWNMVEDAETSDRLGELNDTFIQEGHYALTKASFGVTGSDGVQTFQEQAADIYRRALRRTVEAWKSAAQERLGATETELKKTVANISTDTDAEWERLEHARVKGAEGEKNMNDGKDDAARQAYQEAALTAASATKDILRKRDRTARRRTLTIVWQILLLSVGATGIIGLVISVTAWLR